MHLRREDAKAAQENEAKQLDSSCGNLAEASTTFEPFIA
jgi:hypothetical protein